MKNDFCQCRAVFLKYALVLMSNRYAVGTTLRPKVGDCLTFHPFATNTVSSILTSRASLHRTCSFRVRQTKYVSYKNPFLAAVSMSQGLGIQWRSGVTMRRKEANDTDFPTDNSRLSERASSVPRRLATTSCM